MRMIFMLILLTMLTGCQWWRTEQRSQDPLACDNSVYLALDDETMIEHREIIRILATYGVKLKKKDRIFIESSYAKFDEGQWWIWMDASSQKIVDLPHARYMMVDLVEGLLKELNDSDLVFRNFTHNNLYISVELESYYGRYVDLLYVGRMELKDGNFFAAYAHTALDPDSMYHHMHSEPYETSLIITKAERAADKKIESPYSAFDDLISPIDWETGVPVEKEEQKPYTVRSTESNLPKSKPRSKPKASSIMLNDEDLKKYIENHK